MKTGLSKTNLTKMEANTDEGELSAAYLAAEGARYTPGKTEFDENFAKSVNECGGGRLRLRGLAMGPGGTLSSRRACQRVFET